MCLWIRVARTFSFSNNGHALHLCSPSEIQKITISAEEWFVLTDLPICAKCLVTHLVSSQSRINWCSLIMSKTFFSNFDMGLSFCGEKCHKRCRRKECETPSVKRYLRKRRTSERMDGHKETRLFVHCVCQGSPSYGGRTAMLHRNLGEGIKIRDQPVHTWNWSVDYQENH